MENSLGRLYLLAALAATAGCTNGDADTARLSNDVELIPAEWTVAEDTAPDGAVTTASLQLPVARDIPGLLKDESPRVILRCVGGKVAVYLEADSSTDGDSTVDLQVPVQLDSAPSCE